MVQDYKYGLSIEIVKYTSKKGKIANVKMSNQVINGKVVTDSVAIVKY